MTDSDGFDPRYDARFQRGFEPEADGSGADADDEAPAGRGDRPEGIDPRYDPRFQRGYDPERHVPPQRREPDERPVFSSSLKATPRTPMRGPTADEREARPASGRLDEPGTDADAAPDAAAAEPPAAQPLGRNPYIIGLWAASALLVVVGLVFIVQAATNPTARFVASVAVGDVFARTAWTVSPICVTVGLIGIVALTLWNAVRWRGGER